MNSKALADLVEMTIRNQHEHSVDLWNVVDSTDLESVVALCREGIMGPGKEQYERDGKQKFEDMPLVALIDYVSEESRDLINYGVMVTWRMKQIRLALEELSRRKVVRNLVAEGVIVEIQGSNLSDLSDSVNSLTDTLLKSDEPIS